MVVERTLDLLAECSKPEFLRKEEQQPRGCCEYFWEVFLSMDMLTSISQDLDFALTWWYYADEIKKGELGETLERALLASCIIYSVFYIIFVSYDLFANLVYVAVRSVNMCNDDVDCTDRVWKRCYWAPREIYSFGMIKIYSIVFVDVFKLVLTIMIQVRSGEDITQSLALTNIIVTAFNLVIKLLEAIQNLCDMTRHKKHLIISFKGHSFEPIFVGKLPGTVDTYASASSKEVKVWRRPARCCCTNKSETIDDSIQFTVKSGIKIKCMAVLGLQKLVVVWYDPNDQLAIQNARVYNYDHNGNISPDPSLLRNDGNITSVAMLSNDQIIICTGPAVVTWECNNQQWRRGTEYGAQPASAITHRYINRVFYVTEDVPSYPPSCLLAAKFGNDYLLTADVIGEYAQFNLWRRPKVESEGPTFEYSITHSIDDNYVITQNMFELDYDINAFSGRFVTHSFLPSKLDAKILLGAVEVWSFKNMEEQVKPELELVLAEDAWSIGILGQGIHRRLLIGSKEGMVTFWKVRPLEMEKIVSVHRGPVTCLSQNEDDELLTGSQDRTVCLWRAGLWHG